MPDHINITHPDSRDSYRRDAITIAELRAHIATLEMFRSAAEGDLSAIFTRIERGDPVELHYPGGRVIVIAAREQA